MYIYSAHFFKSELQFLCYLHFTKELTCACIGITLYGVTVCLSHFLMVTLCHKSFTMITFQKENAFEVIKVACVMQT